MKKSKIDEMKKMSKDSRMKKIEELKLELIKSRASISKASGSRPKQIKKAIARILTLNRQEEIGGKK